MSKFRGMKFMVILPLMKRVLSLMERLFLYKTRSTSKSVSLKFIVNLGRSGVSNSIVPLNGAVKLRV
jgi:hypothetical protein